VQIRRNYRKSRKFKWTSKGQAPFTSGMCAPCAQTGSLGSWNAGRTRSDAAVPLA
ncbi:hypothetical protein CERSUDRAFT_88120, partial [Gelatoporia subvermispora B]